MGTIGFIGVGNMGGPMARNLIAAGHSLKVFDLSEEAVNFVVQSGAERAASIQDAAKGVDFVVTMLPVGGNVREVFLNAGVVSVADPGTLFIDSSTIDVESSVAVHEAAKEAGYEMVDAPVSGGQEGAEKGQLTVMVGGSDDDYATGEPAMQSFAKAVTHMGPVGSGQLTKMVNQICCSCSIQALAEGMNFALKAGLDAHQVVDVISKGAAQSWQMENRGKTMVDGKFDFGFACDWMRKDLDICLDEARVNGAQIPLTALIETFYARIQARGEGKLDNSALYRLLSDA